MTLSHGTAAMSSHVRSCLLEPSSEHYRLCITAGRTAHPCKSSVAPDHQYFIFNLVTVSPGLGIGPPTASQLLPHHLPS